MSAIVKLFDFCCTAAVHMIKSKTRFFLNDLFRKFYIINFSHEELKINWCKLIYIYLNTLLLHPHIATLYKYRMFFHCCASLVQYLLQCSGRVVECSDFSAAIRKLSRGSVVCSMFCCCCISFTNFPFPQP